MRVKYEPEGARVFTPGLRPGDVIDVSNDEAKRLIATGAYRPVEEKKKTPKGGRRGGE